MIVREPHTKCQISELFKISGAKYSSINGILTIEMMANMIEIHFWTLKNVLLASPTLLGLLRVFICF
jgi:hypothetical protein